jgi:hypothetical protein
MPPPPLVRLAAVPLAAASGTAARARPCSDAQAHHGGPVARPANTPIEEPNKTGGAEGYSPPVG